MVVMHALKIQECKSVMVGEYRIAHRKVLAASLNAMRIALKNLQFNACSEIGIRKVIYCLQLKRGMQFQNNTVQYHV